jgi:hypothetical protein
LLNSSHKFITILREGISRLCASKYTGPEKNQKVGFVSRARIVTEKLSCNRNVAKDWHGLRVTTASVLNQTAENNNLTVINQHIRFDRTPVGDEAST